MASCYGRQRERMLLYRPSCCQVSSLNCAQWDRLPHSFFVSLFRHMLKQPNGGSIITLSSISASIVNRPQYQVVYNTSKAAVGMMTKCLAAEWATRKIRVNAISPGYMMTDMVKKYIDHNKELGEEWVSHTPMKRIGDPKELRGAVVFLASDAASYMTGSEVVVDGGYLVY